MYIPKGIPKEQEEAIMNFEKQNPILFKKISDEIQVKVKEGMNEQTAMVQVMTDHKDELQEAMMKQKI